MQAGPGRPNPPASKARALEMKIRKMVEKKDYFAGWFCVRFCFFFIMRGSAVSHRFTGAVAQPGSWVMEGGKRGH